MRNCGVNHRQNAGAAHARNIDSGRYAHKTKQRNGDVGVFAESDFTHLAREINGLFDRTTHQCHDGRRRRHGETANAVGFGDRAIANITSGIFRLVACKHRANHLLRRTGKPLTR